MVWDNRPMDVEYVTAHVTEESKKDAINQFHPFRSHGPDGFPPRVLQVGLL